MKRYKQRETATIHIILSKLYLKQGICSVYVMVDFMCMGLLYLQRTSEKYESQSKITESCQISHKP